MHFCQVVAEVDAITLTADTAVYLRATLTLRGSVTGKPRAAGEEWLLTADTTTSFIPPIAVVSGSNCVEFLDHFTQWFAAKSWSVNCLIH